MPAAVLVDYKAASQTVQVPRRNSNQKLCVILLKCDVSQGKASLHGVAAHLAAFRCYTAEERNSSRSLGE